MALFIKYDGVVTTLHMDSCYDFSIITRVKKPG
jgi:hypothetical protein